MERRNHVSGQTGTTGSSPVLTTKFRINYPEIMEGSKLPIGYGVRCTPPPNMVRVRGLSWSTGEGD